jgi:L-aminopeptidase/D-esterase-like protein
MALVGCARWRDGAGGWWRARRGVMALGVDGQGPSKRGVSGCTVILPPPGTLGAVAVRGSAPGTREAAALGPSGRVDVCHAVVLSGGSAFGLASAEGAVRWVEESGEGYPTALGRVPIVGAAIVFDDAVAHPDERPGADAGYAACAAATVDEPPEGGVGVGAGCTVAKVGGLAGGWRSGQGRAVRRSGDLVVGALVANNAVGEVTAAEGGWLVRSTGTDVPPGSGRGSSGTDTPSGGGPGSTGSAAPVDGGPTANTVIGCVVTNARLDKRDAHRVADLGHSGTARAIRPAHTEADGDALFCLATGAVTASLDLVAALAADAVEEALRRGPLAATGRDGLPGLGDAPR